MATTMATLTEMNMVVMVLRVVIILEATVGMAVEMVVCGWGVSKVVIITPSSRPMHWVPQAVEALEDLVVGLAVDLEKDLAVGSVVDSAVGLAEALERDSVAVGLVKDLEAVLVVPGVKVLI